MKILVFSVILFALLSSCSSSKEAGTKQSADGYQVAIHFDIRLRHCGGNPPPVDYIDGTKTAAYALKKFYVKSGSQNQEGKPTITAFTTDAQGNAQIQLPAGSYCIIIPEKTEVFTDFHEKQSQQNDIHTKVDDMNCFEKWYRSCEGTLEVQSDSSFNFTVRQHCGYGLNPCMHYDGPPRP